MNKSTNQNIIPFYKAAGIQILVSEENNLLFSFLIMQKRKNKIKILSKGSGINSFEEIKDKIPKKMPVCMAITGKGILMKEIIAGQSIISPNSSTTFIDQKNNPDLYSQYITGPAGKTYVAIIRKERLDELLGEATKVRLEVISYNIGPLSTSNLEALFNTGDYEFSTKPYHLTVSNGLIAEIKKIVTRLFH